MIFWDGAAAMGVTTVLEESQCPHISELFILISRWKPAIPAYPTFSPWPAA